MIQQEATTIWERFELKKNPGMNSHNHPMYGAVGAWFFTGLAGIRPVEAGFSRCLIRPAFPQMCIRDRFPALPIGWPSACWPWSAAR